MFCINFCVTFIKEVGPRAGTLAIINMVPPFFGFYLSFSANILEIFLPNYRRIHRITGWMLFLLGLIYALAVIYSNLLFLRDMPKNLYAVIVSRWIVPTFEHRSLYFYRLDLLLVY